MISVEVREAIFRLKNSELTIIERAHSIFLKRGWVCGLVRPKKGLSQNYGKREEQRWIETARDLKHLLNIVESML